jgi:acyl transferase domain-containing protein/NAD(P)H-dependent flavin oxidoreductase YrpB (nitropropane dioxygenase family)/NAD(P)-dependent dehydrogenase (short-subunit alcohol dehydrogenase family)
MARFQIITLSPSGFANAAIPIAGCRAGGLGVLDLEYCPNPRAALEVIQSLAKYGRNPFGVKLNGHDHALLEEIAAHLPQNCQFILIGRTNFEELQQLAEKLSHRGLKIWLECISLAEARMAEKAGVAGVIAKGHEAGGWVALETTFVLLQQFLHHLSIPVWAQGGISLHTASACFAAGAAGVVLDSQLTLTRESPLPEAVKSRITNFDGSETIILGEALGEPYRFCSRLGVPALRELEELEKELSRAGANAGEALPKWRRAIAARVGWQTPEHQVFLFGQDIGFAAPLAHKFETVGGIVEGVRQAIKDNCQAAATETPLAAESPLARSHGTRYPIVQGPMARVSDNPAFVEMVAQGGALPFVAAAWMRAAELEMVLENTGARLQDRSWGVGLLGFLPREVYLEQIQVILRHRPRFALVAGGQAHQVKQLEQEGIATYVHVPSPGLLRMFLNEGLTRFVFEGRESGGHVGPFCSFVLFEAMLQVLLESPAVSRGPENYHILFAGGIHDALSASMIAVMAGQLAARGIKVGLQLGTAYLFTEEAVASGAIVRTYQQEVLGCDATTLLVSSPGHAERVIETPFVQVFNQEKWLRSESGATPEEVRHALDHIKLGRLRIATKGIARNPDRQTDPQAPEFINLNEDEQRQQGIYLVGQVAAMRGQVVTIDALHHDLANRGSARLNEAWQTCRQAYPVGDATQPSDIAIVGLACLLPMAANPQAFWENILNKVNAIREVPPERWDWRLYYDQDQNARDKICARWGGFLDDIPFDPTAYGMPPNSLASIEPLQLLTLEVTKGALEDAGYGKRPFNRERTAVVFGISGSGELAQLYSLRTALPTFFGEKSRDILTHFDGVLPEWTEDSFPGILMNVTAGRIANRFNLGGANCTVDAACASSLAAVYWAVRELETGACDMAVVGGADCMQNPFTYTCFSKTQALSPRGSCHALDESADGIVLGEGIAVMILKRLADAERAGDRIYAVIKGVGASSDGRDKSLTAPNREGQVRALTRAYGKAQVSPATVGLIEAHATGTTVGDRIEIESLSQVFAAAGAVSQGCAIGSIKSMIGHTKSTAGLASLIKASLALHHKVLPPTLGVENPNPVLRLPESPFYVNTQARPWLSPQEDQPRRAGVSALGFGGTNFHVVLEEYTGDYLDHRDRASFEYWPSELFFWEAGSRPELLAAISALDASLQNEIPPSLGDLAFTLFKDQQKGHHQGETATRLAVIASCPKDLHRKLAKAREALAAPHPTCFDPTGIYFSEGSLAAAGKMAFLFPGQGSQQVNMLADLAIQFPEIRAWFEHGDRLLAGKFPRPMSNYVFPPSAFSAEETTSQEQALADTRLAQPAMGTADLALFNLLQSLGIRPDMAAGHSYGEYVALCAAGVLAPDDLITLSEARARFIAEGAGAHPGAMAAINADVDTVAANIKNVEGVWVANLNAPQQTVISGTQAGIEAAGEVFRRLGLQARKLPVSCAFHSPLVSPAGEALDHYLSGLRLASPQVKVFSNTTTGPYPAEPAAVARQLVEHLVSPVQFVQEIEAMYEEGARIFVEVGPGQVLTGLVKRILGDRPHLAVATNRKGRSGLESLLHAAGQLLVHGVPVRMEKIFQGRAVGRIVAKTGDQDRKPTSAIWLVNGGGARPCRESADSRNLGGITPFPLADAKATGPPVSPPGTRTTADDLSGDHPDQVMLQYQRLMGRFLDTQKAVMLQYLGNAGQVAVPAEATKQPVAADSNPKLPDLAPVPAEADVAAPLPSAGHPISDQDELAAILLKIVSDKTGYPPEMLGLDLDLEADLGIDSIKRTEIIGHFLQTVFPVEDGGPPEELTELSGINTLGGVIERLQACGIKSRLSPTPIPATPTPGRSSAAAVSPPVEEVLPRFTLTAHPAPEPRRSLRLAGERLMLITDDGGGIAVALRDRLRQQGLKTALLHLGGGETSPREGYELTDISPTGLARLLETIRLEQGPIGALVHLLPLRAWTAFEELELEGWQRRLQEDVVLLYQILQLTATDLQEAAAAGGAWVVAASGLGGLFACDLEPTADFFPGQGGVAGLLKTAALELPEVRVKCVDLDVEETPDALADHLLAEIEAEDEVVEVGYRQGRRLTLGLQETSLLSYGENGLHLDASSIILVTGGARGITAAVTGELARKYRPTLILAGRAPLPADREDLETTGLTEPQALKAALADMLQRQGRAVKLPEVETAYRHLLKEREIRANLAALRETGAQVAYFQVDVRDSVAFGDLLDQIYSRYGRLDGVIHGAGVIEDRLLRDKSWDSFDRVFGTKTESAFILSKKLHPETLKFLVLFSSVAGRFGNRGQADYTAANEVYNKLAIYLDRKWPGRVLTINWGPWKSAGMVSAQVQRQFEERGVALIEPAVGARTFDLELHRGRKGEGEVLIGDGPWRQFASPPLSEVDSLPALPLLQHLTTCRKTNGHIEIVRRLDPDYDLYLKDHRLDFKPVLPAAMAIEFMAEAARQNYPDWHVAGLKGVQVYKGIVLDNPYNDIRMLVGMPGPLSQPPATMELEVAIKGPAPVEPIFYRATVVVSRTPPLPEPYRLPPESDFQDYGLSAAEAYRRFTFHGPRFQHIQSIRGISEKGMITTVTPSTPRSCLAGSPAGQWIIDPVVLDCGLQLALLWGRAYLDITPLPSSFKEIWLYQPFGADETLHCYYEVLREFGRTTVFANIYFFDQAGHLRALIKDFESTGSKALNRLAGSHLREEGLASHKGVGLDG